VSTNAVPPLFVDLVDDLAAFSAGDSAPDPAAGDPLAGWLAGHRRHLASWYSGLVGPLLLPVEEIDHLRAATLGDDPPRVGLIGDARRIGAALSTGGALAGWVARPGGGLRLIESAVAKRGEDPMPGLRSLLALAATYAHLDVYAEIPLAWGLLNALDAIAEARADGVGIEAKFRTGGLASELFPTPVELAAVICACRDRGLRFKLTAGLHRAIRHNDPETGLSHHGFVNILAASIEAAKGAEVVAVAERLASTDPISLVEVVRPHRTTARPLWTGFGCARISEPVQDLGALGLIRTEELPP
jgi:hypothetical protein